MLFYNIVNLVKKGFVSIDDSLKSQLSAEGYIHRGCKNSKFLPQWLLLASKGLKANQDIVIGKADKSEHMLFLTNPIIFIKYLIVK